MQMTIRATVTAQECAQCGGPVRRWISTAFDPRLRAVPVSRTRCLTCGWERTVSPTTRPRSVQAGYA